MKLSHLLAVLGVLHLSAGFAADDPMDEPSLSLAAAHSIPIALTRFRKDQPNANSAHFRVYFREQSDVVEVEFVPEASPIDLKCGEKDCAIGVDSGSSVYGYGLTYVVDKATRRILKVTRSR